MKRPLLLSLFLTGNFLLSAQDADTARIARILPANRLLAPLQYLASDHLRGRHIGLPEIDTAARYIADQFRRAGAKPVPGANGYYQVFNARIDRLPLMSSEESELGFNLPWWSNTTGLTLKNVLAYVPGTDSNLRKQYILLSSHYDHKGVAQKAIEEEGKMDSIFNGARDNATGTAAVIAAVKYFCKYPPRRSILFICFTAEEEGLIGSKYYVGHALIPLNQTVFNLNVDNAAYNTTQAICLFGLGRTSEDQLINKASHFYGLEVLDDPLVGGLFERSDNISFANKGIPAPTYSMGLTSWDNDSVLYRYHRLSDETVNMDLDYVTRFIRAYILAAQYIANEPRQPVWTKNDFYEQLWHNRFDK